MGVRLLADVNALRRMSVFYFPRFSRDYVNVIG